MLQGIAPWMLPCVGAVGCAMLQGLSAAFKGSCLATVTVQATPACESRVAYERLLSGLSV